MAAVSPDTINIDPANVFRLTLPLLKLGSIIRRKGELVKKMFDETRARIRNPDRVLPISCVDLSSPSHFSLLPYLDQIIETFKCNVAQIFVGFCSCQRIADSTPRSSRHDGRSSSCSFENLMETIGDGCRLRAEECLPNKKECNNEKDPHGVFIALDTLLKSSLDRLKLMRETIMSVSTVFVGCNIDVNYAGHLALIRDLCLGGKVGAAFWLRRVMIQKGFVPDVLTHNYIVNGLCKSKDMAKVDWLIREMLEIGPPPNCATYNTIIKAYCLINDVDKALFHVSTMDNNGVRPNRVTINILVHALCKRGLLDDATKLLLEITDDKEKSNSDLITSTILMDGCIKSGDMAQAVSIWNEMLRKNVALDNVAYNVFINGMCSVGNMKHAYGYSCKMLKSGCLPDTVTYNTLLHGLFKEGNFDEACYIHGAMLRMGVPPDQITYKIIIENLCLHGKVLKANKYLQHMLDLDKSLAPEPNVWNLIISGYGRCGDILGALTIRDQMVASGVAPNVYTYNALLNAQVKSGNINDAYAIIKEMLSLGIAPDTVSYNLLIGAASSSFDIHFALKLYKEMLSQGCEPDIITYTELIRSYCMKGNINEAVDLLAKLLNSGLNIDHVPFLILLKKCCQIGEPDMAFDVYQTWLTRSKSATQ